MSGRLVLIIGSMSSGKTEILLRMINDTDRVVQVFKPRIDTRYDAACVTARSGMNCKAVNVGDGTDLLRKMKHETETVFIDEAQFIKGIYEPVREILAEGIDVVVSALSSDYRNRPFGDIGELLATADDIIIVPATCARCGGTGTRTRRTVDGNDLILIGGEDSYESRCPKCWELE